MRRHTKLKHKMRITKYKELHGPFEITEHVFHKCHLCDKILLLDNEVLTRCVLACLVEVLTTRLSRIIQSVHGGGEKPFKCTKDIVTMLDRWGNTAEMMATKNGSQECARIVREYLTTLSTPGQGVAVLETGSTQPDLTLAQPNAAFKEATQLGEERDGSSETGKKKH